MLKKKRILWMTLTLPVPVNTYSFVPSLVLTLPQKSFIPMGELSEDWSSFRHSF